MNAVEQTSNKLSTVDKALKELAASVKEQTDRLTRLEGADSTPGGAADTETTGGS